MSQQPTDTLPKALHFPSVAHLRALRQSLKAASFEWTGLTLNERWEYHAYDYAFLRVRHGLDNRSYHLDPNGDWFNETMVQAAEQIYEPRKPLHSGASARPADTVRDPTLALIFQRQDEERLPLKRQVQIHGERLPNGDPTPEMLAFMQCCVRQAKVNMALFEKRQRTIPRQVPVTATERKIPAHEDPAELRKAARELGILREAADDD